MIREFFYLVGLGIDGYCLEKHVVRARNQSEAYYAALKFLHPDGRNYNCVMVLKRLTKAEAEKYAR